MKTQSVKQKRVSTVVQTALSGICLSLLAPAAYSGENFIEALTNGKASAYLRYRYEAVDQEGFAVG